MLKQAVGYLRVSSENQGKSGFGLDAQRVQIEAFARSEGYLIGDNDWFRDVASGKTFTAIDRPDLVKAMKAAASRRCPMIVADISRLSRNTADIEKITRHPKLKIILADVGDGAGYAVIEAKARRAEAEGKEISRRTKEGLKKAKERGVQLGNPAVKEVQKLAVASNKARAEKRNRVLQQLLREFQGAGIITASEVAEELNRRGVQTPRRTSWTETNVRRVQKQISLLEAADRRRQEAEAYADDPSWGIF